MANVMHLTGKNDQEAIDLLLPQFQTATTEGIVAILDNHGEGILELLQDRLWGEFDWHPLEVGPPTWQFALKKLPSKLEKRSIGEFLGSDHHRET